MEKLNDNKNDRKYEKKSYYLKNREKRLEYQKNYNINNREKIKKYHTEYYKKKEQEKREKVYISENKFIVKF
jgi:hypothetical protein